MPPPPLPLLQATAGYLMAYVYASTGSYRSLFALGCTALALGTLLVVFSRPKPCPPSLTSADCFFFFASH